MRVGLARRLPGVVLYTATLWCVTHAGSMAARAAILHDAAPAFRETNVSAAKRALLAAELPQAYAAAVAELARERAAAAKAFAGAEKSFQAERVAKRMEIADRLSGCVQKDIARGDVTSLCFAEAEIEDLRAFAKYVAEERQAWRTFPENPAVKPVKLNLADFGAKGDGVTDDGPALRSAIAAVNRLGGTPSVLRIPAGTFLIASPDPLTPGDKASNLVFPAVSNCVVTGVSPEKTKLRFGVYDARGLCVLKAYNSVFRNFEIRWQTTPYFQGTILDSNMEEGWFEVGHDPGTLQPTDPKWQVREHPLGLHSFEPDGTFVKEPLLFWDRTAKHMGQGRYRLGFNRGMAGWKWAKPPRKGVKAAIPDRLSGFEGFGLVGARLCTVENVWIRNSREAFLQPSRCYSCAAVRCRIFPEDGRVFSTNADGFYNSRGSWISECAFSNMGDDGCNSVMHGGEIAKVEGKVMLYKGFARPPRPGDLWQIVESTTGEYLANLRVVSSGVREWNGTQWEMVEFSEEIPAGVHTYETIGRGEITAEEHRQIAHGNLKLKRPPDLVFAPWADGVGYVVRNNVFRNNRNTAMVVQCPNALLENNLAEGMQNGLVIGELLNWNEGPAPYNVVVRNNRFVRNYLGLCVSSQMHNGAPPKTRPVRDLLVEGNTFFEPYYTAFQLPAADGPVLRNNVLPPQRRPRLAETVHALAATHVVQNVRGYNSWPMIQAIGAKLVCVYSRGSAHSIGEDARAVYARTSTDNGKTWTPETVVANTPKYGEVAVGKGLDSTGAMLLWVRRIGKEWNHDLYRTTDGVTFARAATPQLAVTPVQITDVFTVPKVGLMALWFAGDYGDDGPSHSWGMLTSRDDGATWTQTTIESKLTKSQWPTEPSAVYLGNGKILVIGRIESVGTSSTRYQFQMVSSDYGATWKRTQTNIGDVFASTPSLILDSKTGLLSNYYYQRGPQAGVLRRRVADPDSVFGNSRNWPASEVVATGSQLPWDAGNANATAIGGTHCVAFYSGKAPDTAVLVSVLPAPTSSPLSPSHPGGPKK